MRLKNVIKAAAVAAAVTAVGVSVAPQSASASVYWSWHGYQVEYDNNPGDRAPSWAWLFNGGANTAFVEVYLGGPNYNSSLLASPGKAAGHEYTADIQAFKVCEYVHNTVECSGWMK
jgi:hypothetical protein